jgi:Nitroreductase family
LIQNDVWEVMSTARAIRRFTAESVDHAVLERCLEAATWAPSGANAQCWRFVVLRSPEQRAVVAMAATRALATIESVYGMSRPDPADNSARARSYRAIYELHDTAGDHTSVLFVQQRLPATDDLLLGGSIYPRCKTSCWPHGRKGWVLAQPVGRPLAARHFFSSPVGIPDEWALAGHVIVGWPRGAHGPVRRHALGQVVDVDHWNPKLATSLDRAAASAGYPRPTNRTARKGAAGEPI